MPVLREADRTSCVDGNRCYGPGMHLRIFASDGVPLHAEMSGSGKTALLFVHGWLGSSRWWDAQRDAFTSDYTVVQVDLAGHGASGRERTAWSIDS